VDCAVNGRSEPELTNAAACMNGGFFSVQLYRQITVPWFGIARAGDVGVRRGLRRVIIPYSAGPCQVHKYIWLRNCVVGIWRKRSPSTATSVKQRPCTLNCSLFVGFESLRNRCRIAKGTPEGGAASSMAVYAPAPVRGLDKGAASPSNAVRPATAGSAANSQIGCGVSVVQYCSAFYISNKYWLCKPSFILLK
jgi:hypothetical protein